MNRNRFYDALYPVLFPFIRLLFPLRVQGRENLPEGGAVVCVNHSSAWDPLIIVFAVTRKFQLHAMAKKEIIDVPVLGWALKKAGSFGVDRGAADIQAVKTALSYLKGGEKLLVFPEGTRVDEEDNGNAKGGIAMMAVRTNVPILPIYLDSKKRLFHRTNVIIGKPIVPQIAGKKGTAEEYQAIAEETMRTIYSLKERVK